MQFQDYEHFWLFYVKEHRNRMNRTLHFCGTTLAIVWIVYALLLLNPWWTLLAFAIGYGFAWIGHGLFEGNKPATFGHPLWSLRGDFRMYRCMLTGTMASELERSARIYPPKQ